MLFANVPNRLLKFIAVAFAIFVALGFANQRKQMILLRSRLSAYQSEVERFQKSETRKLDEQAIRQVLQAQQEAWNAGDIPTFMQSYWKSNDLTFSSGGNITRGWQATFDRYINRYPTREKMGTLTFSNLEISPLGSQAALVLGNWQLIRSSSDEETSDNEAPDNANLGGNFSLVFRHVEGQWVIVHDHTSSSQ